MALILQPYAVVIGDCSGLLCFAAKHRSVLRAQVHVTVNDKKQKCLCGGGDGCPKTPCSDVIKPAK